jgi:IS605 OrfB family transposase
MFNTDFRQSSRCSEPSIWSKETVRSGYKSRHCKKIVQNKPQGIITVEGLRIDRKKANGKKFNKLLGSWSYGQLLTLLKYKAEDAGKLVLEIDPKYTKMQM